MRRSFQIYGVATIGKIAHPLAEDNRAEEESLKYRTNLASILSKQGSLRRRVV
jgi:hypothetical protein